MAGLTPEVRAYRLDDPHHYQMTNRERGLPDAPDGGVDAFGEAVDLGRRSTLAAPSFGDVAVCRRNIRPASRSPAPPEAGATFTAACGSGVPAQLFLKLMAEAVVWPFLSISVKASLMLLPLRVITEEAVP